MTNIYDRFSEPPKEALKTISAGKLKGFTDVNPMWRIRALTELFGPAGVGWYTRTTRQWLEAGKDNKIAAFCNLELYVKIDGEWSQPIEGTGGSMFSNVFKGGCDTSDEAFKMAYTDALSVACKSLGIAANVYWQQGRTKYSDADPDEQRAKPAQIRQLVDDAAAKGVTAEMLLSRVSVDNIEELTNGMVSRLADMVARSKGVQ